jgi:hypothetical protein
VAYTTDGLSWTTTGRGGCALGVISLAQLYTSAFAGYLCYDTGDAGGSATGYASVSTDGLTWFKGRIGSSTIDESHPITTIVDSTNESGQMFDTPAPLTSGNSILHHSLTW